MIEAMGLKISITKFHENLPSCSKVISGGQTDSHI
jgi:hypothetical protein